MPGLLSDECWKLSRGDLSPVQSGDLRKLANAEGEFWQPSAEGTLENPRVVKAAWASGGVFPGLTLTLHWEHPPGPISSIYLFFACLGLLLGFVREPARHEQNKKMAFNCLTLCAVLCVCFLWSERRLGRPAKILLHACGESWPRIGFALGLHMGEWGGKILRLGQIWASWCPSAHQNRTMELAH